MAPVTTSIDPCLLSGILVADQLGLQFAGAATGLLLFFAITGMLSGDRSWLLKSLSNVWRFQGSWLLKTLLEDEQISVNIHNQNLRFQLP
jgi:hypothetical protein